jgi:carbon-monoxide dehydrogenase medium subunit
MEAIRYEAPTSIDQAVELLRADAGARVLAGGTDLLVQFRTGRVEPTLFVDIKRIPDLMRISINREGARIGAAVPCAEIFDNQQIHAGWPGLAEATDLIGSSQIQGRASLGGNLCNSSPAADTVPALIANAALCVIAGPKGERAVAVEDFVTGPGSNVLKRGEFLAELRVPRQAPRGADAYLRLIPRSEMDIAVVGAGAYVALDDAGTCTAARVAIGAVAPTARLVTAAGEALVGTRLDEAALERAAEAARAAADPIDDKRGTRDYRIKVTGVLVKRAAAIAAERARGRS